MTNSRAKGCRGEREWRDQLREAGFDARRGQQFSGGNESPDVVCPSLPTIHFEVKRVEAGNPYGWMTQAATDAGSKIPVVAHKRNGRPWLCILSAEDLLTILRRSDLVASNNTAEEADDEIVRAY
jgi:Holliday junction resolvase